MTDAELEYSAARPVPRGVLQLSVGHLDTSALGTGCMRLVARVNGEMVATAIIELNGDGQPASTTVKR